MSEKKHPASDSTTRNYPAVRPASSVKVGVIRRDFFEKLERYWAEQRKK